MSASSRQWVWRFTQRALGVDRHEGPRRGVADQVTQENLDMGLIYPPQSAILSTSLGVAEQVAQLIFERGLAGVERPADIKRFIREKAYRPEYRALL